MVNILVGISIIFLILTGVNYWFNYRKNQTIMAISVSLLCIVIGNVVFWLAMVMHMNPGMLE